MPAGTRDGDMLKGRFRVDHDVAPGAAVRGRVLVLDGGRAREFRAALEFCELVPRAFEAEPTILEERLQLDVRRP